MGEQADLLLNGDCCEGCGESFDDEGQGFSRRCSSCKGMPRVAINTIKQDRIKKAAQILKSSGFTWKEFNNGYHWRINEVDFWPTKDKWLCPLTGEIVYGLRALIAYLKPKQIKTKQLSVEQMFEISKKVKPMNLMAVMQALHKEIYKS